MDRVYEVVKELKSWSEAAACAVERGGYLVEIDSQADQDTIYGAIIHGAGIAYVWIGASDQHTEGTIPNAAGCDSVITINLTIVTIDTTVNWGLKDIEEGRVHPHEAAQKLYEKYL